MPWTVLLLYPDYLAERVKSVKDDSAIIEMMEAGL